MRIVLDIDGVVADFASAMVTELSRRFSCRLTKADLITPRPNEILGIPENECLAIEREIVLSQEIRPVAGSIEGISRLGQRYDIVFLSSRSEELLPITLRWLDTYNVGFSDIRLVARAGKHNAISGIAPDVWIEDDHEVLVEAAIRTTKILLSQPWNRLCRDVENRMIRVRNWKEICRVCLGSLRTVT